MRQTLLPAALVCALAALPCLLALTACGGDVSWCYGSGDGRFSAGYNTTQCPPDPAAKEGEGDGHALPDPAPGT